MELFNVCVCVCVCACTHTLQKGALKEQQKHFLLLQDDVLLHLQEAVGCFII